MFTLGKVMKGNKFITTELKHVCWSVGVNMDQNCNCFLQRNLSPVFYLINDDPSLLSKNRQDFYFSLMALLFNFILWAIGKK